MVCANISEAILTVSANTSCSQLLTKTIQIDVLGTKEQATSPFSLFPNPTHGNIHLCFNEMVQGKASVEVFNLLGERMMMKDVHSLSNGNTDNLDLSRLTSGIYIIKLSTEKGNFSKKVILR